jgi:hypothetical protein
MDAIFLNVRCTKDFPANWSINLLYNILYFVDNFYTFVNCCVLPKAGAHEVNDEKIK